jgi:hypothetical protein
MRETGIPSQAAPWASQRLRNALVVCGRSVRCCVTPGNGATPPDGAHAGDTCRHGAGHLTNRIRAWPKHSAAGPNRPAARSRQSHTSTMGVPDPRAGSLKAVLRFVSGKDALFQWAEQRRRSGAPGIAARAFDRLRRCRSAAPSHGAPAGFPAASLTKKREAPSE